MKIDKNCTCICHVKDNIVRHIKPCCDYTYVHYINKNGIIDYEIYNKLEINYK